MAVSADNLTLFHPLIARWFRERVGEPTDVQAAAWSQIAAGEHVLITAPTGSGKTLTAFLWALNALMTGQYPTGQCCVVYVSPLKALNNDIQRNLLGPLEELRRLFMDEGVPFPNIRVLTRSGDTPADERRRMQRKPPEILITTPESLNLMLSSRGGMAMFGAVKVVILDEVHAVIDSKRGAHLITAVERMVRLAGEFQRIALSATVRPPELVAEFIGGYQRLPDNRYAPRTVRYIRGAGQKAYRVQVRFPQADAHEPTWDVVARECREIIARNRSTLVFTNTRRLAETLTWKINTETTEMLAYAHHGALSREIRTEVERRMKSGGLRAIVATNSLEMGIDIGSLDEVVLVQSPPGIAAAIQRVGRAGHRVGEVSRGTFFPSHGMDILKAAVLARNIPAQNIEAIRAIRCPLDVLAQVLLSMIGVETWDIDDLYAEIRRSFTFHDLSREQFMLVLNMLAGRYADTRIRDLTAKVSIDKLDNTVTARPGTLQLLYMSGGMIPNRGYYHLRHLETRALIGELDEEYVWEADLGQAMTFGTQSWRIERITHNDVFVVPAGSGSTDPPFYRAEAMDRDFHFAEQIGLFLEDAEERLDDDSFRASLKRDCFLDDAAVDALLDLLERQRESCGALPHRHHLVIEHIATGPDGNPGCQVVLHTQWGGAVNRPFALALGAAWEERYGAAPEMYIGDDAIYLLMAEDVDGAELLTLVTGARLEELLRRRLEGSGFFGARFRECAGRALLVTRRKIGERLPLWVSRLKSKKLLESVLRYPDFPILLETWRTCLHDEFDLDALRNMLAEVEAGAITWSETHHDAPSPFAQVMSWQQMNQYVYMDDTPSGKTASQLRGDLLQEVVFTPGLRPALAPELAARFSAKRRRLADGYAPQSPRDLLDWVKERLLIPREEWQELLAAMTRDHGLADDDALDGITGKLALLHPVGASAPLLAAVENLPRLRPLWGDGVHVEALGGTLPRLPKSAADDALPGEELTAVLGEWLRFYGPVNSAWIARTLGLSSGVLLPAIDDLLDTQQLISGQLLRDGADDDLCDSENFEILLRMARVEAVPRFQPLSGESLPLFLAAYQGLCAPGEDAEDLHVRLTQLSGLSARAELWEEVILPARMRQYDSAWLDSVLQEGEWHWLGVEKGKIAFCLDDDLPLVHDAKTTADHLDDLLPDEHARYSLPSLAMKAPGSMGEIVTRLWDGVWSGVISNDSVAALRKGIAGNFQPPKLTEAPREQRAGRHVGRVSFSRWSGATPFAGNWYRLPAVTTPADRLEEEELAKERARLLLDRYGLLFRELLQNELPVLQWPTVFRALRLMELAGEVLTGCFFLGIPGLQFISHRAFRQLQRALPTESVWWLNACDPASPCGLPLDTLRGRFPKRIPGNFLVFRGSDLVLTVQRGGKTLQFAVPPDDPRLPEYLLPLHNLLERRFQPELHLTVETINGNDAATSPYLDTIGMSFDVVKDYKRVFVSRRIR